MTEWSEIARRTIERTALAIPEDATIKERTKAIEDAYPFGIKEYWPRRAWNKAKKAYLSKFPGYKGHKPPAPLFDGWERDPTTGRPVIP